MLVSPDLGNKATAITNFIWHGVGVEAVAASSFYVAVTRAQQSVAIVLDDPGNS